MYRNVVYLTFRAHGTFHLRSPGSPCAQLPACSLWLCVWGCWGWDGCVWGRWGQRSHALASYWFNTVLITRLLDSSCFRCYHPPDQTVGSGHQPLLFSVPGAFPGSWCYETSAPLRCLPAWLWGHVQALWWLEPRKGVPQQLNDLLQECLVRPASEAMQSQTFLCKKSLWKFFRILKWYSFSPSNFNYLFFLPLLLRANWPTALHNSISWYLKCLSQ